MAQFAGGQISLNVKDSGGNVKSQTPSSDYTIWDNVAVPRVVFSDAQFGTAQGSSDDEVQSIDAEMFASGDEGELLDLCIYHSAAITPATSAIVTRVKVADIWFDTVRGKLRVRDKTLYIADRLSRTAGTQSGTNAWVDNTVTVPYMDSTLVRWKPDPGHSYAPRGIQYAVVDGV